jgi:hypothetical protein
LTLNGKKGSLELEKRERGNKQKCKRKKDRKREKKKERKKERNIEKE